LDLFLLPFLQPFGSSAQDWEVAFFDVDRPFHFLPPCKVILSISSLLQRLSRDARSLDWSHQFSRQNHCTQCPDILANMLIERQTSLHHDTEVINLAQEIRILVQNRPWWEARR
jgi:hypothetical protein